MKPPYEIMVRAGEIIRNIQADLWPEDDWIGMGDDWDLNLGKEDGQRQAFLFPVVDGTTDAERYYELYVDSEEIEKLKRTASCAAVCTQPVLIVIATTRKPSALVRLSVVKNSWSYVTNVI